MSVETIASRIRQMAAQQGHAVAIYCPHGHDSAGRVAYTHDTFLQLEQNSNRYAIALERMGITRGMRTVLMVTPSADFFALTIALFKIGAVPVLVDPGMGVKNLKVCLAEAEPEAFIGMAKAQVARLILGWAKTSLRIIISTGPRWLWGGYHLAQAVSYIPMNRPYNIAPCEADETAAILFTSGSTGVPKGVVYHHGNFIAQIDALQTLYAIQPGDIDLPTFPLFALFAPALGMTAVIPDMDFTQPGKADPRRLVAAIEAFGVQSMFGSPALIRNLAAYGQAQGITLPTLKRVISAGAPVPADVLAQFTPMLTQDCTVYTPYGATEALPVCSISSAEILGETAAYTAQGHGVCVGKPVTGIELRIIAIDDGELASWNDVPSVEDGNIGEITVHGAQVTHSYYQREASTALAKIPDENANIWHRMGDLGYRDEQGRIWFCGRKSHRVTLPEQTLYTIPCEAVFNQHDAVFRSALVGIARDGQAQAVMCIELQPCIKPAEHANIRRELLELAHSNPVTTSIDTVLFHPSFPVDIRHNAKIFREKLAPWAVEALA
ncbi:MAG: fatty acid CoA ligase family protein [Mariprofundaceae bacterium]|nr:fatty acid CoA ligase family protein [Mariprofundaceae bacterium]